MWGRSRTGLGAEQGDEKQQLKHELAVLNAVVGVKAWQSGYDGPDLNRMDISLYVSEDGGGRKKIRTACSADMPTKLHAALEAKKKVARLLGEAAVAAAEERVSHPHEMPPLWERSEESPTADELTWLAAWIDEQPDPAAISLDEADAALRMRRASQAGAAAIARERWSTSEEVHYRPGHFWLAQAPDVLEVRMIDKRCTIESVMFSPGDYLIRIGRYFDRVASDPSGLTFEEWTPPDGSSFVINATELRGVNFTMTPTEPGPALGVELRRSARRAAVVEAPMVERAKEYVMDPLVDDTLRARCW